MKHVAPTEYPEQHMLCVIRTAAAGCTTGYYEPTTGWWSNGDIIASSDEVVEWCEIDKACELIFDVLY